MPWAPWRGRRRASSAGSRERGPCAPASPVAPTATSAAAFAWRAPCRCAPGSGRARKGHRPQPTASPRRPAAPRARAIAERQAALRVIEALNRAAHGAARLEPYLWEEHAYRFQGAQSYQGNIPLPAEFDIFLGFLFSRIGSRLTEEEYRRDILTKLAGFPAGPEQYTPGTPDL